MIESKIYLEDCIQGMKRYEDNYFDLAVVDPPYGIGMDGGKIGGDNMGKAKDYIKKNWDKSTPTKDYFNELLRVSKNQIIFGANHFIESIPNANSSSWIVWDKDNTGGFADCELAWTSFENAVRKFKFRWNGMLQQDMKNKEIRLHPTQKPVALYSWIFANYANPNDKILDTHLGSGSSRIAADKAGLDFTGFEIDKDYFEAGERRYQDYKKQLVLF